MKKSICFAAIAGIAALFVSCNNVNSLLGGAKYPADQAETYAKAVEILKEKVDAFCERFSVARRIPLRRENSSTFTVPFPYFAHRIVFKGAVKPTTLTFSTKGRVVRTERVTAAETVFAKPVFFTTLVVDPDTCPEFELFEAPRLVLGDEEL